MLGCKGSSLRCNITGSIPHTAAEDRREMYMVALESGMVKLLVGCLRGPGRAVKGAPLPHARVFHTVREKCALLDGKSETTSQIKQRGRCFCSLT